MRTTIHRRVLLLVLALPLASLHAQSAPTTSTPATTGTPTSPAKPVPPLSPAAPSPLPATAAPDDAIVLSPFEVKTGDDSGYQAGNTTSGSRLNTKLKDTSAPHLALYP